MRKRKSRPSEKSYRISKRRIPKDWWFSPQDLLHMISRNELKPPVIDYDCVALYGRRSKNINENFEHQLIRLKRKKELLGYKRFRPFNDDGRTGINLQREGFQSLLHMALEGKFGSIIFYKLDRFARNSFERQVLFKYFSWLGIDLISCTEPLDTSTATGKFFIGILSEQAQFEREVIRERIIHGLEERMKKYKVLGNGKKVYKFGGGDSPFGYSYKAGQDYLKVNIGEANIVRTIFDVYEQQESLRAVANYLNSRDIKTKKGCRWSDKTVKGVLSRKRYIGHDNWRDIERKSDGLQIVDGEQFHRVEALLKKNGERSPNFNGGYNEPIILSECHRCGNIIQDYDARFCCMCGNRIAFSS